ncbi:penicillin acylase family protein [Xanthomonas graminis]|uniref:penicillin acylase family protein n=2 Tax=Xanthomonas graminis TaxID=3390026 RepID=UPI003964880E
MSSGHSNWVRSVPMPANRTCMRSTTRRYRPSRSLRSTSLRAMRVGGGLIASGSPGATRQRHASHAICTIRHAAAVAQLSLQILRQTIGPSARLIIDLGNWDNSRAVNYPGQSGDPACQHYRDHAPLWLQGKYFPLLYTRAAIDAATEQVIDLVPAATR